MNDIIEMNSTSSSTADVSSIVLSQTNRLRFKFMPVLVKNEKEPHKSVSGKLIFEKKKQNDSEFPSDNFCADKISRGTLKTGDWMELSFDTSDTYAFFSGLKRLYDLYESISEIPFGTATYTRIDSNFKEFIKIIQEDPSAARMIGNSDNYELVKMLLRLITQTESTESLKKSLSELQDDNLQHLNQTLSLEKLQRVSKLIYENLENDKEEFWQADVFKNNQWVLSQIFSSPCTIFEDKAYVGGKSIGNKDGNLCDFIYQNTLSQNVVLIEIKTPCTKIIGDSYRNTHSFSTEMSGAINQVLNYKDNLIKEYYCISSKGNANFDVFNPKCVVVIGKISDMTSTEVAAFENYRNSLNNIIIITFDELYQKIIDLISVLSSDDNDSYVTGNDFPF